jgi:hypothetical protein
MKLWFLMKDQSTILLHMQHKSTALSVAEESALEPLTVRPSIVSCHAFVYRLSLDFASDQ